MRSRFFKNTVFGTATALSTTLGTFFISLVVAHLLGVAQTGNYTFAVWIITTASMVTGAGLPFTLSRFLPEIAERDSDAAARQVAGFVLRPALAFNVMPLVLACGYALWLTLAARPASGPVRGTLQDWMCWVLMGLACMVQANANFGRGYLRGMQSLHRVAMLNTLGAMAQIVLIAVGTVFFGLRGSLAGYLIGATLPCLVLLDFRSIRPAADREIRRRIARYTRYRWASEIAAAFVFSRIEVFFLHITSEATSVGLFAAALTLANLATQGPLMLTWGLLPRLSEQFGRGDFVSLRHSYAAGTRILAFLVIPACVGLAAIMPDVLPLLYGRSFAGAVPAATILVMAASTAAVSAIGSNLIWAMEKSNVDLYFNLVGAGISVLVGLPLIAHFGLMGAVAARMLTQLTVVGLGAYYIVRTLGFSPPYRSLMNLLFAALCCAAVARLCIWLVPGVPGIGLGVAIGMVTYLKVASLVRALEPDDVVRLCSMMEQLPKPMGRAGKRLAEFALT